MESERMDDDSFLILADGIEDNERPDSAPQLVLDEARRARAAEVAEKARADKAEANLKFYREREQHFAAVLGVVDGGQYRHDWDARLQALMTEIATLRQRVEELTQCRHCKRALNRRPGPICADCSGAP